MSRRPTGVRQIKLLSAVGVVVGLAVVYGAGTVTHPMTLDSSTQLGQESRAAVTAATRACPAPGSVGATAASLVTAAVPGSAKQGTATVTRLTGVGSAVAGSAVASLTVPNVLRVSHIATAPKPPSTTTKTKTKTTKKGAKKSGSSTTAPSTTAPSTSGINADVTTIPSRGGVMVQASGALAQGLAVEQTGPGGLASAECPAPGTDFWFVGPGATAASQIQLYLMNTDSQPADVVVTALTDSGPLLGSSDTGVVVPPHGIVVQSLGKLLHAARVIALHVATSIGRVAAAVRETKSLSEQGGWLPVAQAPAKTMVIPGLPSAPGSRVLYIAVPGTGNAQVKVTAVTRKGSYQPTGGNGIDLAGDSAVSVQLPSLSGVPAAIKITSSAPVTASIMVPGGASGAPGAFSATATPISEQGIAADNPIGSAGSASLVISAPGAAASVRIVTASTSSAFSSETGQVVHVAAGHTTLMRIKAPAGKSAGYSILVTPLAGSGPVYVGRIITAGGIIRSILPVPTALTWVPLPGVQDSLDAASTTQSGG